MHPPCNTNCTPLHSAWSADLRGDRGVWGNMFESLRRIDFSGHPDKRAHFRSFSWPAAGSAKDGRMPVSSRSRKACDSYHDDKEAFELPSRPLHTCLVDASWKYGSLYSVQEIPTLVLLYLVRFGRPLALVLPSMFCTFSGILVEGSP